MYIYTVVLDLTQEHGNYQTLTFFVKSLSSLTIQNIRENHIYERTYI